MLTNNREIWISFRGPAGVVSRGVIFGVGSLTGQDLSRSRERTRVASVFKGE